MFASAQLTLCKPHPLAAARVDATVWIESGDADARVCRGAVARDLGHASSFADFLSGLQDYDPTFVIYENNFLGIPIVKHALSIDKY